MIEYFRNPVLIEKESILRAMRRAAAYATGIVIDVGCGEKPYAHLFAGSVEKYFGTDLDLGNNKQVDLCADSLKLPIRSSSVETVVSNQVIEHVRDPRMLVSEAVRVLKPGGVLIITAPQLWCLHEKPHDYYRFTRYALELLCSAHNLEILLLEERFGAFAAIGQMIALMAYLPNSMNWWRRHASRMIFGPAQILGLWFDRLFYNSDLTLGYVLIARKRSV